MVSSPLSELYFSKENVSRIQRQIKKEIYKRTNGKYQLTVDQNEQDLLVAMRAVYLENTKSLPNHIVRQVKELNKHTINYIVPDMITNIKSQAGYLRDIDAPIVPPDRPLNVSHAGRKTLPSLTSAWGF